jgi:endonuclease/exonuclease/phosphatase family metal-dependent hydrolase
MKGLSLGYKIIYIVNNIFAVLLLLSYLTSFISPADYPISGILNFSIPLLWIINGIFVLIWLIKLKKQLLLSLIIMAIGWFQVQNLFVFPSQEENKEKGIKVMSYNVMQFYNLKEKSRSSYEKIQDFLKHENPDIICFQEYRVEKKNLFADYEFRVINNDSAKLKTVILSKYPIINSKHYGFGKSNNSAVYADIVINGDTLRVFSIHFESLNLKQDIDELTEESNRRLAKRLNKSFSRQIFQIEEIEKEIINSPYPVILSADMNNTAFSHLYRKISGLNLKDTFLESGEYYGQTFSFFGLPVRIDMIFSDDKLKPINFKNFEVDFSDHRPVMAEIGL